jgi:hypothetical protein
VRVFLDTNRSFAVLAALKGGQTDLESNRYTNGSLDAKLAVDLEFRNELLVKADLLAKLLLEVVGELGFCELENALVITMPAAFTSKVARVPMKM